jgi:lipopolysaccharide transport system ATP-binding protein
MMVRLAFAVIAHVDADILVIDEALAVGDTFFTQKCMRFLRSFMKTGTILFVSHDTTSVRNLCNKAIWLEKGNIIQQGSPKEVCEAYLEAFFEAQQGKSTSTQLKIRAKDQSREARIDQRHAFLNASNLRNDIKIFEFDPDTKSFGKGQAQITNVQFLDVYMNPLAWIVGGEDVILRVDAVAHMELESVIVGFYVNDKLGQTLFGDNTYLVYMEHPVACRDGENLVAEFYFQMPRLATGDYSVTVALANGTQQEHVQHHWIHDAISFRSESTSVAAGLIGISMTKISMGVEQ